MSHNTTIDVVVYILLLLSIQKQDQAKAGAFADSEPDEKEGKPIFTQDSADMMYNFLLVPSRLRFPHPSRERGPLGRRPK